MAYSRARTSRRAVSGVLLLAVVAVSAPAVFSACRDENAPFSRSDCAKRWERLDDELLKLVASTPKDCREPSDCKVFSLPCSYGYPRSAIASRARDEFGKAEQALKDALTRVCGPATCPPTPTPSLPRHELRCRRGSCGVVFPRVECAEVRERLHPSFAAAIESAAKTCKRDEDCTRVSAGCDRCFERAIVGTAVPAYEAAVAPLRQECKATNDEYDCEWLPKKCEAPSSLPACVEGACVWPRPDPPRVPPIAMSSGSPSASASARPR